MHTLDMKHGQVNPIRITKYNNKTCRLEAVEEKSYPVVMSEKSILHGAVCFTADEAALIKADLQTKCKNARHERSSMESEE